MEILVVFLIAFFFSFIGSIPPGTLNLSVLQLGLANKMRSAWLFSVAAALVEYPYGWIAVRFEKIIAHSPFIVSHFELIGALTMIALGALQLFSLFLSKKAKPIEAASSRDYGFAKGLVLSLLNPLAIPYWIGITAYLVSQQWISLDTSLKVQVYLAGVCLGALALLMAIAYLARSIRGDWRNNSWVRAMPGIALLVLGIYALAF
jgi:threonine/homoserine/homoserine lactone efflux protein